MSETIHSRASELIKLLTDGDAEAGDLEDIMPNLMLAIENPTAYIDDYPEDEWILEGNTPEQLGSRAGEKLFAWTLSTALEDFSVAGDRGDDAAIEVVEMLADKGISVDELPRTTKWSAYIEHINAALREQKANKAVISLDFIGRDSRRSRVRAFIVPFDKLGRTHELLGSFGMKPVQ